MLIDNVKEYKVIRSSDIEKLIKEVNKHIENKWFLIDGIVIEVLGQYQYYYLQTLVKINNNSNINKSQIKEH